MMEIAFEPASAEHVRSLADIFNYYVEHTAAFFILEPLGDEEMRAILFFENPRYASFAIRADKELAGFISLHSHRQRAAYRDTAEVTVCIAPGHTGRGIGLRAVGFIEEYAQNNGFHVLLAGVTGGNTASERLFEKKDYVRVAHFKELGYKMGQWRDVLWYEKIL